MAGISEVAITHCSRTLFFAQISSLDYYNAVMVFILTVTLSSAVSSEYLAVCNCNFDRARRDRDSGFRAKYVLFFNFYSHRLNLCSNRLSLRVYFW